ncbi:MAG TPA: hypothetical protein VHE53_03180 [Patescibacteria group bacterium]|nr:hypothetical protein [Patescibacteria group bacterium]
MDDQNSDQQQVQMQQAQVQTQTIDGQEYEIIGGVACPIDPFEREMCDSCQ